MRVTRSKAIRLKCLECMCGQANEVRLCLALDCPLYRFRFGYEVDEEDNRITKKTMPKNTRIRDENDLRIEEVD